MADPAVDAAERLRIALTWVPAPHRPEALEALDTLVALLAEREAELERLLARAEKEPLGVDISDYGDEWCAGFLQGQLNALEALARPATKETP